MDPQTAQPSQLLTASHTAGLPTTFGTTNLQAHGVTTNSGSFVQAGGNVSIQSHHYYSSSRPTTDILDVLRLVPNLRKIHLDVLSKAAVGTVVWFLKTKNFLLWVDRHGILKILWGTGIPGAGKTVMASIVIKDLETRAAAANGSVCVAYIYFRYSDASDLTIRGVLEILVKQIVERHHDCALLAEQAYAQHLRERTQPTETELFELLSRFTEGKAITFYVLDALDEAPERLRLVLLKRLASMNVRLFITSRPLKDVEGRFPHACSFPISAQEGDLDLHINQEIANSSVLEELLDDAEASFKEEMISLVKKNCGGMFLHASLQLDAIGRCTSMQDVIETLEGFPSEIDTVYKQAWERICRHTPKNTTLAKAVFIWVLTAARSMTIDELRHALATSPDTHKFERKRLVPAATLLTLCCGLIVVEEETKFVRLVHYTAKDTLEELLRNDFPHPHSILAVVCMTHLAECGFQNTTIASEEEFTASLQRDPLLAYAVATWDTHAGRSLDLLDSRRQTASFVSECRAFPAFVAFNRSDFFDILGPLHILATYKLPIDLLPPNDIGSPNIALKFDGASPLMLAARFDNVGMVQTLLRLPDLEINFTCIHGASALVWAVHQGHEHIVNILLACPGIQVGIALLMAVSSGREGTVKLLIAHPKTHLNFTDDNGYSALIAAASSGQESIAKLLLACPDILPDLVDNEGQSALIKAAREGHEGIVKLFLSLPEIYVNLADNTGWTALMWAAARGHEGIVKLFLAHPNIHVNLVDNKGQSALMKAALNGREGVFRLLLEFPHILLDLVDNDGRSALAHAAGHGREGAVRLFLAQPEIGTIFVDNHGDLAFTMAASVGYEGIVKPVLHLNTRNLTSSDCSFQPLSEAGGNNGASIFFAAQRGDTNHIRNLIESGKATANDRDDQDITPLHWAAINGYLEACCYLLEQGAEVDAIGGSLLATPMQWAARKGYLYIIQLLIAHNADPNLRDSQGYDTLHLVTHSSSIMTLLYLLQQPINVDSRDRMGHTPLMWALYQGDVLSVDIFLQHGADIHSKDDDGLTPLHWAVVRGDKSCMRRLLENDADLAVKDRYDRTPQDLAIEMETLGTWNRAWREAGMNDHGVKSLPSVISRSSSPSPSPPCSSTP